MGKSPEEIGREYSQRWYEAEPGTPYHTVAELIAAAIREDRAELETIKSRMDTLIKELGELQIENTKLRAALEATRQARANSDEKGGAR